ncbi:MAG: twin-arginine translocation pathway signal protein [Alphaproteobacteria bacterium]
MRISRRTLMLGGGALAVVAGAGVAAGAFAFTRRPSRALQPWEAAEAARYDDPRLRALAYAILAPNPHNRQPWLVELAGDDSLVVYCDLDRRLPETDPFDRQVTIGLGCFLELLRLAAAADGHETIVEPFPAGEPAERLDERPVARLRLRRAETATVDPLFHQVLRRRSNKEPYDTTRPVAADALAALRAAALAPDSVGVSNEPSMVETLRALTWRAFETEIRTPRTFLESARLMRIGKAEIEANPDGIDIEGFVPDLMKTLGLFGHADLEEPDGPIIGRTLDMYRPILGTGMAYLWIATAGNSRRQQLAAGRDWLRINLAAAALGIGVHPVSQALQEFPEMGENFAAVHRLLDVAPGGRVQMLGRLGHGPDVGPSPRWPLESRIKPA